MVFALVAALGAIAILYWLANKEIGDSLWSAHLSIKETRELLTKGVFVAGIVTFVAVLLFGFWSMIDAHRIAGPMHRLKNLLDEITGGVLTHQIMFRKRDEFHDVAASADALVDSYAKRLGQVKALALSIEGEIGKLPSSHSAELLTLAGDLRVQLEFFKLPEEAS
jgi:methyl-accepting chemotaxis protein